MDFGLFTGTNGQPRACVSDLQQQICVRSPRRRVRMSRRRPVCMSQRCECWWFHWESQAPCSAEYQPSRWLRPASVHQRSTDYWSSVAARRAVTAAEELPDLSQRRNIDDLTWRECFLTWCHDERSLACPDHTQTEDRHRQTCTQTQTQRQ